MEKQRNNFIHPTVILMGTDIAIGEGAVIGPYVVIYDHTHIHDGVAIGPHSVIGVPGEMILNTHVRHDVGVRCIIEDGISTYKKVSNGAILKRSGFWAWVKKRIL